jgi:Zn-dependent M28 family amino/carboxypeptidase
MAAESSLITLVSRDHLVRHLHALVGERHPYTSPQRLQRAQEHLVQALASYGLDVTLDEFSYTTDRFVNVIARPKPCSARQPRVIVGAHVDTVPGTPGADDNTSGLAVMLEAARVLSARAPEAPVEFVGFNLEELSMVGSHHYATTLKRERVPLLGMLSLEMVGFTESQGLQQYPFFLKRRYPPVGNFIGLAANRHSTNLLRIVEQAMRTVPGLPVETLVVPANGWVFPEARLSDHSPFWDRGYPALLVTDTAFFRNPHYHQPTDTLETLDVQFLEKVCQGVVAAVVALTASTRAAIARSESTS